MHKFSADQHTAWDGAIVTELILGLAEQWPK